MQHSVREHWKIILALFNYEKRRQTLNFRLKADLGEFSLPPPIASPTDRSRHRNLFVGLVMN